MSTPAWRTAPTAGEIDSVGCPAAFSTGFVMCSSYAYSTIAPAPTKGVNRPKSCTRSRRRERERHGDHDVIDRRRRREDRIIVADHDDLAWLGRVAALVLRARLGKRGRHGEAHH